MMLITELRRSDVRQQENKGSQANCVAFKVTQNHMVTEWQCNKHSVL